MGRSSNKVTSFTHAKATLYFPAPASSGTINKAYRITRNRKTSTKGQYLQQQEGGLQSFKDMTYPRGVSNGGADAWLPMFPLSEESTIVHS